MYNHFDPVKLAQALIRCPSITPHDAGAIAVITDCLTPLGFDCQHLTFTSPHRDAVDNLLATRSLGGKGKHLVFAGHTDVVPPGNEAAWMHPPFSATIDQGRLYGRGSEDMKGSIACFISAVSAFIEQTGGKTPGSLSLMITGDEEGPALNGTEQILRIAQEQAIQFDHCIVGEPTGQKTIGDTLKIGRRGSLSARLTLTGKQGHTAQAHRAINPCHYLVNILQKLITTPLDQGNKHFLASSLQLTSIDVNNPAYNVIPQSATANLNIRFNDQHSGQTLIDWIQDITTQQLKSVPGVSFYLEAQRPSEPFLQSGSEFSTLVTQTLEEINGYAPQLTTDGGTSDARFIHATCPVIELGLINHSLHQINESVSLDALYQLRDCYLAILHRYFSAT